MMIAQNFTICSRLLDAVSLFFFILFSSLTGVSNVRLNRATPEQDVKLLWLFSIRSFSWENFIYFIPPYPVVDPGVGIGGCIPPPANFNNVFDE